MICVIKKVYLQRYSNVSLENGKKDWSWSTFWKAVTQYKSIQSSEEDSSPCLVCQFTKQRLILCHCFWVLLMRRYWRCSFQLALPLAFAWFSFGTGQWTHSFFPISSETLEWRSRKTFVITRNDTITCLFVYLERILNRSQQHLLILSLYMVFTQLNMICANLLDNYYDSMARLAAFWVIIMGCLAMSHSPMLLNLSGQ